MKKQLIIITRNYLALIGKARIFVRQASDSDSDLIEQSVINQWINDREISVQLNKTLLLVLSSVN